MSSATTDRIRDLIVRRGRVEGDLLLVDEFLNHRVDIEVMSAVGAEIAAALAPAAPDLLLTAEASGIPPALAAAAELRVPVVYAKKFLGVGDRYAYSRVVTSPTKGTEYRVEVARRVLGAGMSIAVVDDFLAGGRTAEALGEITEESGNRVVGFAFVVEKTFCAGRDRLEAHGWPVWALVRVASLEGNQVVLASA